MKRLFIAVFLWLFLVPLANAELWLNGIKVFPGGAVTATSVVSTGTISGNMAILNHTAAAVTLTAAQMRGYMHENGDADAIDWTLPDAAAGLNGCFNANGNANTMTIDVSNSTNQFRLNGTTNGAGNAIDSAGGAGDFICMYGTDATIWNTLGRSGAFVNGGTN